MPESCMQRQNPGVPAYTSINLLKSTALEVWMKMGGCPVNGARGTHLQCRGFHELLPRKKRRTSILILEVCIDGYVTEKNQANFFSSSM